MNESKPKLSIIVPVYNVGYDLLRECLYSIGNLRSELNPYRIIDFEVIVVNDCSPAWLDESDAITQYKLNYQAEVKVIHHTKNKGLAGARNTGFMEAKGECVWFVDSDDCIVPTHVYDILKELDRYKDASICQMNAVKIGKSGNKPMYFNSGNYYVMSGPDALNKPKLFPPAVWSKIYRRSFLVENNILHKEGFTSEDQLFTAKILLKSLQVIKVPMTGYFYRVRENSIMTAKPNPNYALGALKAVSDVKRLIEPHGGIYRFPDRYEELDRVKKLGRDCMSKLSFTNKMKVYFKLWK